MRMLPHLGFYLVERLRKRRVYLLVLSQPLNDFQNRIDLRHIRFGFPLRSEHRIAPRAKVGEGSQHQEHIRKPESTLPFFALYAAHGSSSVSSSSSNGSSDWSPGC